MSLTSLKIASGLAAVFLGGAGVGYFGSAPAPDPAPPAVAWSADILGRLTEDLGLTSAQQQAFAVRLDEAGAKIEAQRERALFQIHLEVLAVHDRLLEIPGELSPAQSARLAESRDLLERTISERFKALLEAAESTAEP